MANQNNSAPFFDSADNNIIDDALKGMTPLGARYAAGASSKEAQNSHSSSTASALDKKIARLTAQLNEKNKKIEELEYKLAHRLNDTYRANYSANIFSEQHKKEILDNIVNDIRNLYTSVSTRAKLVEDREYQILLKMVQLEQRQRELDAENKRRLEKQKKSPIKRSYEEFAEEKLLPTDEPELSRNINRSIDKYQNQLKKQTPFIELDEEAAKKQQQEAEKHEKLKENQTNFKRIRTEPKKYKPTPLYDKLVEITDDSKPRASVSTPRVQSLREALAKDTEGLDIFDRKKEENRPSEKIPTKAAPQPQTADAVANKAHPSEEIKREYEKAKAQLDKKRKEEAKRTKQANAPIRAENKPDTSQSTAQKADFSKASSTIMAEDIEVNELVEEINKVLGEQHKIESKLNAALKKDAKVKLNDNVASLKTKEQSAPLKDKESEKKPVNKDEALAADEKPTTDKTIKPKPETLTSETMEIPNEDISFLSSLLDEL